MARFSHAVTSELQMDDCSTIPDRQLLGPCPSYGLLPHLTGKWTIQVMQMLARRGETSLRFGEIQKGIDGLSRKMLATTLRMLERDGLVERRVYPDVPPRVEYRITATGSGFLPALDGLAA
jgi:DNA-binding HxlR family transcriptional regulator